MNQSENAVRIREGATYITEINFFHVDPANQQRMAQRAQQAMQWLTNQPGFLSVSVFVSTDGTRLATYVQWDTTDQLQRARAQMPALLLEEDRLLVEPDSGLPRLYDVVYANDRSRGGVTTIAYGNRDTIFINEITTQPATQNRLLELVIANNEEQSFQTPGYRSANFHKSRDGERAVNYSLWDSEQHLIEAITAMADEDVNLEETMAIATPDFRFYTLLYTAHN